MSQKCISTLLQLVVLASLYGCHNVPKAVRPLARTLEDAAQTSDEFGSASISAPVFTSPEDTFKFALPSVNATTFFNDAKTSSQANVADFNQAATIAGFGANVAVDPTKMAAYAAALSQYTNSVGINNQSQSLADQKRNLTNALALQQYQLSIDEAAKETDPTKKAQLLAQAQAAISNGFSAPTPTTSPAFPTASVPNPAQNIASNAADAAAILSNKQLSGFQSLLQGVPGATGSDRDALFQAAGDNATAAIFQVLGDPSLATKFADKKVLIGVVNVAVNPGWRTKQGYTADVSSLIRYNWQPARLDVVKAFVNDTKFDLGIRKRVAITYQLPLPTGDTDPYDLARSIPKEYLVPDQDDGVKRYPLITAVAPMTQSDVEHSLASSRSQTQLALDLSGALSAAGLNAQASFFDHFAKSLQHDVDTITESNSVNTYSVNGQMFGFEVGPRLRSVAGNTKGTGTGTILERQSFPAMIIFGFEDDELRPRVQVSRFGEFRLVEPWIRIGTTVSWHPLTSDNERLSEHTRLELISRLDAGIDTEEASKPPPAVDADLQAFLAQIAGQNWPQSAGEKTADLQALALSLQGPGLQSAWHSVDAVITLNSLDASRRDSADRYLSDLDVRLHSFQSQIIKEFTNTSVTSISNAQQAVLRRLSATDMAIQFAREASRSFSPNAVPPLLTRCNNVTANLRLLRVATDDFHQSQIRHTISSTNSNESIMHMIAQLFTSPQATLTPVAADELQKLTQDISSVDDMISAARTIQILCYDIGVTDQQRKASETTLCTTAAQIQQQLFPPHQKAASQSKTPSQDVFDQSEGRAQVLRFKTFSGIYDAPLPVSFIEAQPTKHPAVTTCLTDFVPSATNTATPKQNTVGIYLIGKDLDTIDTLTPPQVLLAQNRPNQTVKTPVIVVDGPTTISGVTGVAVVHLRIDPSFTDSFSLQLKQKSSTDSINTPPVRISNIELPAPKEPVIRRITGPRDDPANQQIDEQQFYNVPGDIIKDKIEERKANPLKVDINVTKTSH